MNALARAIDHLTPNTQAELARRLSIRHQRPVTPQQVNAWCRRGWAAPRYATDIEAETNGAVTCAELVADIPDRSHGS